MIESKKFGDITIYTADGTRITTPEQIKYKIGYNPDLHTIIKEGSKVYEAQQKGPDGNPVIMQLHSTFVELKELFTQEEKDYSNLLKDYEPPKWENKEIKTSVGNKLGVHNYFDAHIDKLDKNNTPFKTKLKKQLQAVLEANNKVLGMGADETMVVVGGDYYNTDHEGKTTKGTPQVNSINEIDAWKYGVDHIVEMVDRMSEKSPVTLRITPGNHDWEKLKYLNTVLEYIFKNHVNVKLRGNGEGRQYHRFGSNLLMYHHGHFIKDKDILGLVNQENNLGGVNYIESNKGHSHTYKVEDLGGAKSITNTAVGAVNHRGNDLGVGKDHNVLTSSLYDKKYGKEATIFTNVK